MAVTSPPEAVFWLCKGYWWPLLVLQTLSSLWLAHADERMTSHQECRYEREAWTSREKRELLGKEEMVTSHTATDWLSLASGWYWEKLFSRILP